MSIRQVCFDAHCVGRKSKWICRCTKTGKVDFSAVDDLDGAGNTFEEQKAISEKAPWISGVVKYDLLGEQWSRGLGQVKNGKISTYSSLNVIQVEKILKTNILYANKQKY